MTEPLDITRATPGDLDAAHALMVAASERQKAVGAPNWKPSDYAHEDIGRWIARRELILARRDGDLVGLMLLQTEDGIFWPEDPPGEACYLHRLAVAAHARSTGVSQALMAWARVETKVMGRVWLRLDCVPLPKLCAVYEGAGFQYVDRVTVMNTFVSNRYQQSVA